jgi:predicted nucleic-acid-binding Zn-ribbon protein
MEVNMDSSVKCLNCGGTEMASGSLHSTGRTHFRPSDAKFLKLKTANIELLANMCLNCGSVNLVGDVEKAKQVTEQE